MTITDKLLEYFGDRSRWTTEYAAVDQNNDSIAIDDPQAVSRCLLGGIHLFADNCQSYRQQLERKVGMWIGDFNDQAGYEAVMDLLRTIKEEEDATLLARVG